MKQVVRDLLEEAYIRHHTLRFIKDDPLQVPHRFSSKQDIEISALLTASIAWGQRKTIINNASRLMNLLDNSPYEFVLHAGDREWFQLKGFVHRTFQPADLNYFLDALRRIYQHYGGLETLFNTGYVKGGIKESILHFRQLFMSFEPLPRTQKHVSDPSKGSAAKRLNLFLMWMVRQDELGIHFGLWKQFKTKDLIIPLDVHVGRVARALGLLDRNSNDWQSAELLTKELSKLDPVDPTRFDFALFGLGLEKTF